MPLLELLVVPAMAPDGAEPQLRLWVSLSSPSLPPSGVVPSTILKNFIHYHFKVLFKKNGYFFVLVCNFKNFLILSKY